MAVLEGHPFKALYKASLAPNDACQCCACGQPLKSGTATFLNVESQALPFGKDCAEQNSVPEQLQAIPDLTNSLLFQKGLPRPGGGGHSWVPGRPEIGEELRYAIVREELLPKYGINLSFGPTSALMRAYRQGIEDHSSLRKVIKTIRATRSPPEAGKRDVRHLSPENLMACLAYADIIQRLRKSDAYKGMTSEQKKFLFQTEKALQEKFRLSEGQAQALEDMGRTFLPRPLSKVRAAFVRPPRFEN